MVDYLDDVKRWRDYYDLADEIAALINKRPGWTLIHTMTAVGYFVNAFFTSQFSSAEERQEAIKTWTEHIIKEDERLTRQIKETIDRGLSLTTTLH